MQRFNIRQGNLLMPEMCNLEDIIKMNVTQVTQKFFV